MASSEGVPNVNIQYSDYFVGLEGPVKSRYHGKITVCGFDPYALRKSDFSENIELLPNVQYPDIVNYLVVQTSWATKTQMKAYKSMEAYNFFVSGWVNTLCMRSVDTDKVVVFARVNHSQRARDTPLRTWFLAEKCGTVIAAHCDCMAGLCEGCSHVGAVLFAVEAGVRIRDSSTSTQEKNKWLLPSHMKEIPYLPVSEMDFTSAKKKHELMVEKQVTPMATRSNPGIQITRTPAPTPEEHKNFFTSISGCTVKPAVLSLVTPFNEQYICKEIDNIPKPLPISLFKEECMQLDYMELLRQCRQVSLEITPDDC
ncbi:uncharacterized protein LOC111326282 [Stylophora pistillata]|uniref:uncharacterized protein LOC111326282 n=1 Tax=Stylophora pistillata TaxID=50429 RepID=UPI000C0514BF|nr:uncharacterized protein LOC111326282 [Stylophora pistillata]